MKRMLSLCAAALCLTLTLTPTALAAQGSSRITHTEFIDRGYADFAQKLTALGGQIARETPRGADCPKKRTSKT